MIAIFHDLRHAVRRLGRTPGFSIVAVLTVALGIGATTAVFSVVDGVLIKPLPYPDADSLVGVWHTAPGIATGGGDVQLSTAQLFTYREQNRTFEAIGLWSSGSATVTGRGDAERVRSLYVSDATLQILGVQPAAGRRF